MKLTVDATAMMTTMTTLIQSPTLTLLLPTVDHTNTYVHTYANMQIYANVFMHKYL